VMVGMVLIAGQARQVIGCVRRSVGSVRRTPGMVRCAREPASRAGIPASGDRDPRVEHRDPVVRAQGSLRRATGNLRRIIWRLRQVVGVLRRVLGRRRRAIGCTIFFSGRAVRTRVKAAFGGEAGSPCVRRMEAADERGGIWIGGDPFRRVSAYPVVKGRRCTSATRTSSLVVSP
jgi:hypothetical protein